MRLYNFEKALNALIDAREKAKNVNTLISVLGRLGHFKAQALQYYESAYYVKGLIHESITCIHLFERLGNPRFLDWYFGTISHALSLSEIVHDPDLWAQVYRRMGDYFYEIGEHEQSLDWYKKALVSLSDHNSPQAAEYCSPLGRALTRAYPNNGNAVAEGVTWLEKSQHLIRKHKKKLPKWHFMIIKSGIDMRYAEAIHGSHTRKAQKYMKNSQVLVNELERMGYPQRSIQWSRLNSKYEIFPQER